MSFVGMKLLSYLMKLLHLRTVSNFVSNFIYVTFYLMCMTLL